MQVTLISNGFDMTIYRHGKWLEIQMDFFKERHKGTNVRY